MIDVFVRAAGLIGLPRSIGEIYGLLFCSPKALSFDELVERLQISKGSVSQGLKVLRQLGAVKLHWGRGVLQTGQTSTSRPMRTTRAKSSPWEIYVAED